MIILVAFGFWFGIRSLSWFLFASKGTPFVLKIIRAEKIETGSRTAAPRTVYLSAASNLINQIKGESRWLEDKGGDFLGALLLPPLQVIAAVINFIVLVFTAKHLFELPLRKLSDLEPSSSLIQAVTRQASANPKRQSAFAEEMYVAPDPTEA